MTGGTDICMKIPVKTSSFSEVIKGSRFLSESFVLENQSDVKKILKSQKQKYADATHVCHAFIFGKNAEIMGMSDDGEPGGTAGRPMLDVLKGRGVTNVLVTVTRWFGGTLLGTGGLVHAYASGTKAVLDATVFEDLVEKLPFRIETDYQNYQTVRKIIESGLFFDVRENFAEKIILEGKISACDFDGFAKDVFDRTNGKISVEK